jgi:hypothetical protein
VAIAIFVRLSVSSSTHYLATSLLEADRGSYAPKSVASVKRNLLDDGVADTLALACCHLSDGIGPARLLVAITGNQSATVATLGGQPETHILGETFYSQAPLRYGDFIAKIAVAPISPELTALTLAPLYVNGVPDGLRKAVVEFFKKNGGVWEVRAQLCTNLELMPIENAAVVWPEGISPYQPIARITVKPQVAWSKARSAAVDDGMSFSPWHGLAVHRPLGGIMPVRKAVYEMAKRLRAEKNGRLIEEPREMVSFENRLSATSAATTSVQVSPS